MNMDSPVVSRGVSRNMTSGMNKWVRAVAPPLGFPWYASVVEEFGSGLTGKVL
jgi:hypothetical protein